MRSRSIVAVLAALGLAACAGGGGEPVGGTIAVTGQDYEFQGVPELVATGAEFTFTNASAGEVHELILMKIADGETRTMEELLALPEEESESLAEFMGVLVALPGDDGVNPEAAGATSVAVGGPGRYALVCFIPQGADPAVVAAAMEGGGEGPPDMGDGTPHAFLGMIAEFQVEEA